MIFPGKLSELTLGTMSKIVIVWIEGMAPEVAGSTALTNISTTPLVDHK